MFQAHSLRRAVLIAVAAGFFAPTQAPAQGFSWFKKKSANSVDVDARQDVFSDQASDNGSRSSAFGSSGTKQPSAFRRFTTKVSDGTKSATSRMSSMFKRDKGPSQNPFNQDAQVAENDPVALSTPAKPSASFYLSVAQMHERTGNLAGAEQFYQKALALEPKNLQVLLDYAHMKDRAGSLPEAAELYRTAIKYHPKSASAHNDLGICLARQDSLLDAMESINEAIRLDPQRKLYRNNLAKVLVKANRPQDAMAQLAAVHPPAIAHYNMGYLLYEQQNLTGAEFHFGQALAADPQFAAARQWCDQLAAMRGGQGPLGPAGHPEVARRLQPPTTQVAPVVPASPYGSAGENINVPLPPGVPQ
ncbi:MAG: tetratricopeptide repeat protein [Pirellulales bacterium]|nr:tetratricopeptide repeat protein [Pirellulales bacterium]